MTLTRKDLPAIHRILDDVIQNVGESPFELAVKIVNHNEDISPDLVIEILNTYYKGRKGYNLLQKMVPNKEISVAIWKRIEEARRVSEELSDKKRDRKELKVKPIRATEAQQKAQENWKELLNNIIHGDPQKIWPKVHVVRNFSEDLTRALRERGKGRQAWLHDALQKIPGARQNVMHFLGVLEEKRNLLKINARKITEEAVARSSRAADIRDQLERDKVRDRITRPRDGRRNRH